MKKPSNPSCGIEDVTLGNPAIVSEGSIDKPESRNEIKTRGFPFLPYGKFCLIVICIGKNHAKIKAYR
jgi:hypothetical protein